jgi:hypothetical protein
MPLGRNVEQNIRDLYADNRRSGRARGASGKPRSRKQIIAIALNAARESAKKRRR